MFVENPIPPSTFMPAKAQKQKQPGPRGTGSRVPSTSGFAADFPASLCADSVCCFRLSRAQGQGDKWESHLTTFGYAALFSTKSPLLLFPFLSTGDAMNIAFHIFAY